jgi:hypothetical protein
MRRQAKHIHRKLTNDEQRRVEETRRWAEQNKDEIRRMAKEYRQEANEARATLREALQLLKAERLRQGLSLCDLQERTGIEPPNLSRLENETETNPTIGTLIRYADALGKRLLIVLADKSMTSSHA